MGTHPIKFFLLNKHELNYEVLIRGEEPAPTVLGLRKQINKLTPIIPTSDIYQSGIEPDTDISGASASLNELVVRLKSLEEKYDPNLFERTRALACHVHHRIKRIDSAETSHIDKVKSLSKHLTTLFNKINNIAKSGNINVNTDPTGDVGQSSSSVFDLPVISVNCDRSHISELQKIKFDGKSCVHAFVQRVNEFSTARNIPYSKLLTYAAEVFTGDALHWYRSIQSTVTTWDELVALLIEDFSLFDYDYRLLSEIRNRTQGDSENITIYFAKMSELFSRLTRNISEQDKLEILMHNIRPCYSGVLASNSSSINSIENLKMLCRNYERIQSLTSQFKEPPRVSADTLAPDLAFSRFSEPSTSRCNVNNHFKYSVGKYPNYNNSKQTNNSTYNKNNYQSSNSSFYNKMPKYNSIVASINASSSNTKQVYCPRCRNYDHSLSECKADRFPICFKCGTKNVKHPDCPNCHPKSNSKN